MEDVHTPLGGLLFTKGSIMEEREIEILEAFLIKEVVIEPVNSDLSVLRDLLSLNKDGKKIAEPLKVRREKVGPQHFSEQFDKAVTSFKNIFQHVQGGQSVQVMEARTVISSLIQGIEDISNLMIILKKSDDPNNYLYEHCVSVGLLSYIIAKWMKLPDKELMQVALAGVLMDIGKTKVNPKIIWKTSKLTPDEFEEMKQHTVYGYDLLKNAQGLTNGAALAALQHHEREDGSGYPLGIKSEKIHLYSKIIAIADIFHAMCSDRLHQKATSPFLVAEALIEESFGRLDPKIVRTFIQEITQLALGTKVELSDGSFGKVIYINPNNPTRPMVEVNSTIINLSDSRNIWIVRAVI
nr:HD-GYP domain-containing protein [Brevibacillus daliensis]